MKIWVLCLLHILEINAQNNNLGKPYVENHTREEYQGGTHNWEIASAYGKILIANNDGLLTYDGHRWNLNKLPNKSIARSITVDSEGKIYVGGQDEIGYFFPDPNGILQFKSIKEKIPRKDRNLEDVWDIEIVGTKIFARSVNKIYIFEDDVVDIIDSQQIINFLKKVDNQIYFNLFNEGLYVYANGEVNFVPHSDIFANKIIVSVAKVNGELLVFSANEGIFKLQNSGFIPWNKTINNYLKQNEIISAEKISDHVIAVGTALDGIIIFDHTGKAIQHLNKNSGLQNNNILSIYSQNNAGNIWVGSSNGVDNITNNSLRYIYPDNDQQGGIYDIAINDNSIYFGTSNGLYSCEWKSFYDPLNFKGFKLIEGSMGQVWGLDTIGNSLFMGHNSGAYVIENGKAIKISPDPGYWKFFGLDNNRKVIAGGYEGLTLFEKVSDKWQYTKKYEGFKESSRLLVKENNNRLWVAHPYRGIFQINFDDQYNKISVKKYTTEDGLPSLFRNHVFSIDGRPVFTGEKNIYRFNEKNDSFVIDTMFQNLFGTENRILRIFEDLFQRIWYLTENDFGLFKIEEDIVSKNIKQISYPKLADKFVNGFEELFFTKNGDVMILSESGVIHILNPGMDSSEITDALISSMRILNHQDSIIFGGYTHHNKIDSNHPTNDGVLSLSHNHNSIRFEYFNDPLSQNNEVMFNPYIEGIDENENTWTYNVFKDYTRLQHGNYTFTVSAKNKDGNIGKVAHFNFRIKPPWHKTKVANLIYLLSVFLFLVSLVIIPRSKYRKKVRVMEDVQEKTKDEIDQLKNDKLRSEINFKNQQLASSMMHIVQKNEVLNKVKEEAKLIKKHTNEPKANKALKKLISLLSDDERLDEDWEKFTFHFDQVHTDFLRRLKLKYPKLSPKDQKICAYLRMNLSTKEIAPLLNISVRGVEISRYRLRKKLLLDSSENLNDFMMNF